MLSDKESSYILYLTYQKINKKKILCKIEVLQEQSTFKYCKLEQSTF